MRHLITLSAALVALGLTGLACAADAEHGKQLVTQHACTSCHGANLASPIADYPKIAGQYDDYIAHALMSYRDTNNPMMGRKNAVMAAQAAGLSDADIKDIAEYVSSLPGPLVQKK